MIRFAIFADKPFYRFSNSSIMKSNVKSLIQLFQKVGIVPRYILLCSAFAIKVVKSRNILILKYHRQHIPPDAFIPLFSF